MKLNMYKFLIDVLIANWIFCIRLNYVSSSCSSHYHCQHFEYNGTIVNCDDKHCICTSNFTEGNYINCAKLKLKRNRIGGPCPCPQSNAFCMADEDICYCSKDYRPSFNERHCIKKAVSLNEICESDDQCQGKDFNSICDPWNKTCICANNFLNIKNVCKSLIGRNFECKNNADCFNNYGDYVSYCGHTDKCYCIKYYIASVNDKSCLLSSQYSHFCMNDIQCRFNMGLGAKCVNNKCECIEEYFLDHRNGSAICSKKIHRGQYCLTNDDCYQRQLKYSEQSMRCLYGECQCKIGFYSFNDGECQQDNYANKILPKYGLIVLSAALLRTYSNLVHFFSSLILCCFFHLYRIIL